ncbi:hypothetical protein ABDK00_013295 [Niabella insulamsoli]|uniref:hypothetical protein n=1 Tax=Niabella insulamsoli TaxID=3144874 RepID=UPI0031FCFE96
MFEVLKNILAATSNTWQDIFSSHSEIMSDEVKKILSNPKDKEEYYEALQQLEKKEKEEVTIKLSDGNSLTLVS